MIPVLTYDAQRWSLTKNLTQRIIKTQNSMLKTVLGIRLKEKIRTKIIKRQSGSKNIRYKIKKLKFNYAGHGKRQPREMEREVYFLIPNGL